MARGGSAFLEPSQPSSHPSSSTLAANETSPRRNHGATSSWLNAAPTPSSLSSPHLNASPSSKSSSPLQSRRPVTLQSRPLTRSITDSGLTTIRPASSGTTTTSTTTPGTTDGTPTSARSSYFDTYQPYKLNPALTPSIKAKSSSSYSSTSASRSKSERNLRSRARYDAAGQAPMPELKREVAAATKDSGASEVTTSSRDMLSASTSSKSMGSQGIRPSSSSSAAPSPSIANFKATKLASEPDPPSSSRSPPSNKAASVDAWRKMAAQAASRDPRGFASSTVVAGVTRRKSQQDLVQQAAAGAAAGGQSSSSASTLPAYRDVPLRRSPLPASMQEEKTATSSKAPVDAAPVTSKVEVEVRPPTSSSYVAPTYAGSTAGMRKSSVSHPDLVKMPARSIDDIVREYKEKQAAAAAAKSQPGQASRPALLSPAFETSPNTSGPPTPMAPRQQLSPSAAACNAIDVDEYDSDGSDDLAKREMQQTLGSDLPQTGNSATPRRQVRRDAKAASPNPSPRLVHATSFPSKLSTSSTSSSSSSSQQRHRKPSQPQTQTLPTRSSAADLPPWLTSTSAAAWLYEDPTTATGTIAAAPASSASRNRTVSLTSSHSARTTASSDLSARRQASTSTTAAVAPGESSTNAIEAFIRSPRLTRILTLSRPPNAGLRVSLADVGDPTGHPTILYLGLGAVRYLAGLYDDLASALGLRLICIDRWGIGRTDNVPSDRRGILQWSSVVIEVADRLGVQRFSLLAHSAGAPYAMATALLHRQRVVGPVHLLAPWVSPEMETGYKWLRYVPEQIIRTAQAAEWRVAGWRLGKGTTAAAQSTAGGEVAQAAASSGEEESFDRAPLSRSRSPLLEGGRSATAIPTSASVPVVLPSPLTGLVPRSSSASAVATSSSSPTTAAPPKAKTTFLGSFFSSSNKGAGSNSSASGSNAGRNASSSYEGSEPSRLDEVVQRGAGSSLGAPSTPGSATTPFASSPSVGSAAGAGAGAVASPALSFLSSLYPSSLGELDSPVVGGEQDPRLVNGLFSSSEWEELQDEESRTHQGGGIGASPTSTLSNGSAASALPRRERSLHRSGPGPATAREGAPPSPTPSFSPSDRRMLLRAGIGGPSSTSSRSSSRSNSLRGAPGGPAMPASAVKSASHHADLATALLRASHAEIYGTSSSSATGPITSLNGLAASSNEALVGDLTTSSSTTTPSSSSSSLSPGTTSDLLTILGKSGPWGFTFTDVLPLNVPLRIWHGDKDERIGLGGAFWLQKEWGASGGGVECRLNVVKGAGHGLLTNGGVVVEVLESLKEGWERG